MLPREISDFAREAVEPIRARKQRRAAEDELLDHLETVYEQNLATGMEEKEAAENAVAHMGKLKTLQARYADLYGGVEPRPMHVTMDCLGLGLLLSHLCLFISPNTDLLFQVAGGLLVLFSMLRLRTVSEKADKIFFLQPAVLFLQIFAYGLSLYFGLYSVPAAIAHLAAWVADGIFLCALYPALCEIYNSAYEPGDPLTPGILPALFLPLFGDFFYCLAWWDADSNETYRNTSGFWLGNEGLIYEVCAAVIFTVLFWRMRRVVCSGEPQETRLEPFTKKSRRRFTAVVLVFALLPILGMAAAALRVPSTAPYTQADTQSTDAAAAREHLVSLGLPADIAADLPDSEVLLYTDMATMQVITDSISAKNWYGPDITMRAYQFWGDSWENSGVRTLFCLQYPETYTAHFRESLYFQYDRENFIFSQAETPSRLCLVLADKAGETVRVTPLQESADERGDDFFYEQMRAPIGCENAFPRGSTNRRVYIAATRHVGCGSGWGQLLTTESVYSSQQLPFSENGLGLTESAYVRMTDGYSYSSDQVRFLEQWDMFGYTQAPYVTTYDGSFSWDALEGESGATRAQVR